MEFKKNQAEVGGGGKAFLVLLRLQYLKTILALLKRWVLEVALNE